MRDPVPQDNEYPVDPQAIKEAYREILDHNAEKTGFGTALTRLISAQIKAAENPDNIIESEPDPEDGIKVVDINLGAVQDNIKHDLSGDEIAEDLIGLTSDDLFLRAGISVKPLGESMPGLTRPKLTPHIVNNALFLEFVRQTPMELDDTTKTLLDDVAESTAKKVRALANQDTPESQEALYDALFNFDSILGFYQERGVGIGQLAEYSRNWQRGTIREYIKAEEISILGDTPSLWHLDKFRNDWKNALPFVDELSNDERTSGLAAELRENLIRCIDKAVAEINDPNKKSEHALNAIPSLVEIKKMLSDEQYDFGVIKDRWF